MKLTNTFMIIMVFFIIIALINYCGYKINKNQENFNDQIIYNYRQQIPPPSSMCVGANPQVSQIFDNFNAVISYFKMFVRGPPIGNSYFIKSGSCSQDSEPECRGQDKYMYINNKPTGRVIGTNYYSNNRGLLNGLMEDVSSINPFPLYTALKGNNSQFNKCQKRIITTGSYPNFRQQRICSV